MLIADNIVQEIKNAARIEDIAARYLSDLKRRGNNLTACCPFHHEKTPSFSISPAKDIYKCFGCGRSGDAIRFVMEHEKQTYYEALHTIAGFYGIQIQYQEQTKEQQQKASAAELQEKVLNMVVPIYQQQLLGLSEDHPARQWLRNRNVSDDVIAEWNIGWAGAEWQNITPTLINQGLYEPANNLGIIKRSIKSDSNYDGYRSRITFPIADKNGRFIGLAGRYIKIEESDAANMAKWINPSSCEIYDKSHTLFGFHKAAKAISQTKTVYIAEGYMDVIAPHICEKYNVVASCGTALTHEQMRYIKRFTDELVWWGDNDAAGRLSFSKHLPELLRHGFKVSIAIYDGKDPDEYCQPFLTSGTAFKEPFTEDAILYRVKQLWSDAGDNVSKRAEAKQLIIELLATIPNEILRSQYTDEIIKLYKWNKAEAKQYMAKLVDSLPAGAPDPETDEDAIRLPEWVTDQQKQEFEERGYISVNRKHDGKPLVGYYGFTAAGKQQITNFLVHPLFHVYAGVESRFLLEINNGYRRAVLDVPARNIPAPDQFQNITVSEGNFVIFGGKQQWLRIASDLLQNFPRCIEINHPGWQSFGFFAFTDKVYIPGKDMQELDNWGIIKLNEENFLIPAACAAYKQLQRTGGDPYEQHRYLTYRPTQVTFSQWAKLMERVYLDKGTVAVAYCVLTIFRDIIFEIDNNCPHLYGYGEPSSGKSKWAESISALFYYRRPAFNVNSGTDFAFFNYMSLFINCPAHLNEFDIEVVKPEWFQAIKGIFDGESRQRGKLGSKNAIEIMKVQSTIVLTGQKLVTADDNSLVTRSIIEPFSTRDDLNEDDKKAYQQLKDMEQEGINSILLELLKIRDQFKAEYKDQFNALLSRWRKQSSDSAGLNQRILQNYAHMATCYSLASKYISLPQPEESFKQYCYKKAVHWSHFIRNSDTLSEFWRTLQFLADQQQITDGWDYIIETASYVRLSKNRNEEYVHSFDKPTKVIYVRISNIHKLFEQGYRVRTGKQAMSLENLMHYFSSRRYYLGPVRDKVFRRFVNVTENRTITAPNGTPHTSPETSKQEQKQKSSCYAFLYDDLGIEIERHDGTESSENSKTDDLPF